MGMAKILLIDDETQVLNMLTTMLKRKGHEVWPAANGAEGLRIFTKTKPDLVITDLFMDTQDGLGTIMEIKRSEIDVPIIAISGGGWTTSMDYLKVAEKMGVNRTFTKPISNKELLEAIDELTSGSGESAGSEPDST